MATAFPFRDMWRRRRFHDGCAYAQSYQWTCLTRVRLAAYIVGLVLAIDVSVLLHAILSDEIVPQVR